jgi:hypothetical protein
MTIDLHDGRCQKGETIMSWIQTYTGKAFYPLSPRAEEIDIVDIAHSLSLLCRFNGHCRVFYSVAEHSVRVSETLSTEFALWGLLHDAAEAYVSDLPHPIKATANWFQQVEDQLLAMVAQTFDLGWPMPPEVREADNVLLATEARDLMVPAPKSWNLPAPPLDTLIEPVSAPQAERMFLERYETLRRPTDRNGRRKAAAPAA